MNFVVLNHHIGGLSFGTSVQRIVRALGFTSFREFLQKDSHHIIPYLVPAIVKNPGTSQLLNDIGKTMMVDTKTLIEETFQVSSEIIDTGALNVRYFYFILFFLEGGDRGSTVVKVPCNKSEGRWFDPS